MEIQYPRRILAVSLTDSAQHLSDVIKDLTGTHPSPSPAQGDSAGTLAGTTHPLPLSTPYYTASVPVWLDLISSPPEWSSSFLSAEAKEVLEVLGGVLVVFAIPPPPPPPAAAAAATVARPPSSIPVGGGQEQQSSSSSSHSGNCSGSGREQTRELIAHVGRVVREGLGGWEWEGVGLGVGVSSGGDWLGEGDAELDEWEDLCAEWGLEFVHVSRGGKGADRGDRERRNEFGERMGMARVLEALQANDWSGAGLGEEGGDDGERRCEEGTAEKGEEEDLEFDPESLDFGFDKEDFVGLRNAIWDEGSHGEGSKEKDEDDGEVGEEDVQKLERMMLKLQAVRDATAGLPEEQRKRMAARAVGEVMKEL
ncbi:hypothetical protein VTI74DRAFT_1690 [Chaetomium olivicolor]